jgi:hypothetical protein
MTPRVPRRTALAVLASALAALPVTSGAHDCVVACASQPGHVELQLQSQYGSISREEGAGSYGQLALFGSAAVGGGVTVSALVPTYTVAFAQRRRTGLGDISLAVSRGVVRGDGTFYLALAGHLPTGDADAGLGAGHVMAMLGAGGTWAPPGRLRLGVDLLDALAPVVSTVHHHATQLVSPHSMHELFYEGWASYRLSAMVVRAGLAAQTALASGAGLRTSVAPTLSVAFGVGPGWSASAGLVAPAAGRGYFGWQTAFTVTKAFGAPGCAELVP